MKSQFWMFVVLVVIGAVLAGYASGRYEGIRTTRLETQRFLSEFSSATELDAYLQQRGQKQWGGRLTSYGIGGPSSYLHSRSSASYLILAGITCAAVGIVGLAVVWRRHHEGPPA